MILMNLEEFRMKAANLKQSWDMRELLKETGNCEKSTLVQEEGSGGGTPWSPACVRGHLCGNSCWPLFLSLSLVSQYEPFPTGTLILGANTFLWCNFFIQDKLIKLVR